MATDHNFKVKNGLTVLGDTLVVNHTGDVDGTQVYIKKKDSSTNLMRWGEGTSGVTTYKWRLDQSFDFIGSNGTDVIVLKSSDGSIRGLSYKIGTTTIIDSSRNLSNIGTISSGAITSSGNITLNSNGSHVATRNLLARDTNGLSIGTTNATTAININNSANVSIGTGAPLEKLSIGNNRDINFHIGGHRLIGFGYAPANSSYTTYAGKPVEIRHDPSAGSLRFGADATTRSVGDSASVTTRLTISSSQVSASVPIAMGGTNVIDASRNLVNIGTISSGAITATTINTGQGATEVYLMNQNVRSSDSPTFQDLTIQGNLNITGDINSYNVTDLDVVDKTITLGVGGTASANDGGGIIVDGANAKLTWNNTNSYWQMNKQLAFNDTATTSNQGLGIRWTGFDKEGTSDSTDRASIIHTINTGGHSGSVLLFTAENDANDGIAFTTNASSNLKHNSSNILTAANFASNITSVSNADTVDSLHASSFLRSDASDTQTSGSIVFGNGSTTNYFRRNNTTNYTNAPLIVESYGGSSSTTGIGFHISGQIGRYLRMNSAGVLAWEASTIWHAGNDGSGSGLDADLLDGKQGSDLFNFGYAYSTNNISRAVGSGAQWYKVASFSGGVKHITMKVHSSGDNTTGADSFFIACGSYGMKANIVRMPSSKYNGTKLEEVRTKYVSGATYEIWVKVASITSSVGYLQVFMNDSGVTSSLSAGTEPTVGTADATLPITASDRINYSLQATSKIEAMGGFVVDGSTVWHAGNDGSGSGLDADTLDGVNSGSFLRSDATDTATGALTFEGSFISKGHSSGDNWMPYTDGNFYFRAPNVYFDNNVKFQDGSGSLELTGDSSSNYYMAATGDIRIRPSGTTVNKIVMTSSNLEAPAFTANGSTVWHAGNDGSGSGLDADLLKGRTWNDNMGVSTQHNITVDGDSDKYYPVVISGLNHEAGTEVHIERGYGETAPSDWNTASHKGGLSLRFHIAGAAGWGGYPTLINVEEFGEIYSRILGGIKFTAHSMKAVVWLRGGTATYRIFTRKDTSIAIYDDTSSGYTSGSGWLVYDNTNNTYDVYENYRTQAQADTGAQNEVIARMPIRAGGTTKANQVNYAAGGSTLNGGNLFWNDSNDGSGSGLDADTLDGQQGSYYAPASTTVTLAGTQTITGTKTFDGSSSAPWRLHVSNANGSWDALTFQSTTEWGDSPQYGVLGGDGTEGLMLRKPHVVWNSSQGAADIRLGRSGGTSSGKWVGMGVKGSNVGFLSMENTNVLTWDTSNNVNIPNGNLTRASNTVWDAGNDGSGSGLDADTLDGLQLHTGRNNEANKVVRTDVNGYIQAGWINTTSGNNGTTAISRIYASQDGYIRYYTPANFGAQIGSHISYNDLTNKPTIPSSSSFVDLSSAQTITGAKTFTGNINQTSGSFTSHGFTTTDLNTAWQAAGTSKSVGIAPFRYQNSASNKPESGDNAHWGLNIYAHSGSSGNYPYGHQLSAASSGNIWQRWFSNGSAGGWRKIWDSGNDGSGSGLDADTLDGINSGSFVRSDAADTLTGALTMNVGGNAITISSTSPQIRFNDTDHYDHWIHVNSNRFYVLSDRDGNGSWETPYPMELNSGNNTPYLFGNKAWTAGNDGSGSGLDADTLDGINSASFARSDAGTTYSNYGNLQRFYSNTNMATASGSQAGLECFSSGSGNDAFMTFHVGGDYAVYLGLDGGTNKLSTGGWSNGAVSQTIWHAGTDGSGSGLDADLLDGQHGSYYYPASSASTNDRIYITDTRGANRAPSYYDDRYVQADFTQNAYLGLSSGVDAWGTALTVSKWSAYDASHRQEQLIFAGTKLARRVATSDSAWSSTYTIWDSSTDGSGSGLDADTLDGINSGSFLRSDATDSASGTLSLNGRVNIGNSVTRPSALNSDSVAQARIGGSDVYLYVASLNSTGGYKLAMQAARASDFANFTMNLQSNGGALQRGGNTVWDAGNDGSGSGLDADVLDGLQASSFLRSDTADTGTTITLTDAIRADRFEDQGGDFFFREGLTSGRHRHLNLADTTNDPASVSDSNNPTGISWGQRTDSNGYYMFGLKGSYNNGYSTHSRMAIGWHTGIEIGANATYGGVRFMSDSPFVSTTQIFGIGDVAGGHSRIGTSKKLFFNGGTSTYGIGAGGHNYNSGYFDTLESGSSTDPLELVYYQGNRVNIGASGGSKPLGCSQVIFGNTTSRSISHGTGYSNHNAVKITGNWNEFEVMGRVLDVTGSNCHFMDGYGSVNHASHYLAIGTGGGGNGGLSYVRIGTTLNVDGDVVAYYSDARLKQNVETIPNALEILKGIRGVTFEWNKKAESVWKKKEGDKDFGMIAQEVDAVFPMGTVVQGNADKNKEMGYADPDSPNYDPLHNGEKDEPEYKTIKYDKMVTLAIQAIKEQQEQIEELKQQIKDLQGQK